MTEVNAVEVGISEIDKKLVESQIKLCNSKEKDHSSCSNCEDEIEEGEEAFGKLQFDYSTPLYNSSKIPKIQFIVPTSQTDWEHDACSEEPGSVQNLIQKWCGDNLEKFSNVGEGDSMVCNVTSLPKDIMDIEVMRGTKNNVLLLPYFLWIRDLRSENVNEVLDDLVPILLSNNTDKDKLLSEKQYLYEAKESSFVFICSHRTRDKRCGITAPYLKKTLDKELQCYGLYRDNSDLRPDGVNVQFINHVGGHKFAANVQIYLKKSNTLIWLGRVTPTIMPLIAKTLLVPDEPELAWPEKVRCIKKYEHW